MKHFTLFFTLLTLLTTSCTTSSDVDSFATDKPLEFCVDFDNTTRIEIDENMHYRWQGGETLGVYVSSAAATINIPASVTKDGESGYCRLMAKIYNDGDRLYAYYPWDEHNDSRDISTLRLELPTQQKQSVAGEFAVQYMPMVSAPYTLKADQTTPTVYMRPLAGFICAKVYASTATNSGESVLSVSYKDSDSAMSGYFTLDATAVTYSADIDTSAFSNNSVTVSLSEPYAIGSNATSAKSIYLTLAAGEYNGEITVTTNKAIYTYPYARTVARNSYYNLNIDLSKATQRKAIDSQWGGGSGQQNDPYLISSAEDIVLLAELINGSGTYSEYSKKSFRQVCDIDLSGIEITSIGATKTRAFKGIYDGGGFTINGVKLSPARASLPCGLFAHTSGAEIKNLTVKDFTINSTYNYQSALVGYAEDTQISNCTLEGKINFYNLYSGAMAGQLEGGTVSNCHIKGSVENNVSGITLDSETNVAYTAGIVGIATDGAVIEGCTVAGDIATMGRYCAGIVARIEESTVRNCTILNTAEISNVSHYCGGIVALMTGNSSVVDGCRNEGRVNTSYPYAGAIVASQVAGKVTNCISTKTSTTTSYEGYSGGIVGQIATSSASDIAIIDHCSVYGQVEGAYNVGGIVGYVYHPTAGAYAGITNCAVVGSKLISRGANSNGYNLVGGLAGWLKGSGKIVIAACSARPYEIHGAPISKTTKTKELIAGLVACFDSGDITMDGCYSDLTRSNTLWGFEPIAVVNSGTVRHGALFGYSYNNAKVNRCYGDNSLPLHGSVGSGKSVVVTNCSAIDLSQMTDGTLLSMLRVASKGYVPVSNTPYADSWTVDGSGFPIPANLPADSTPIGATPKRVSVIGDSISTFRGYIPYSYSTYYPRGDGTFLTVEDTYWHRLIYKHMSNARLERNIAYSGSCVTNTDSTKDTYFAKRFMTQHGVGEADIVIIHGGTNDWRKLSADLVPGLVIDATKGPTDAQLAPIFAAADAAKSRAQIEALNDTTFCEAYVKLIKLIKERNPKVKIVCIIGDYINVGIEQATLKMAAHYDNVKCVNLLAVNGYNDQTHMPKLYYSASNTNQCHPNQQAMAFIAEKIYTELGDWLEN